MTDTITTDTLANILTERLKSNLTPLVVTISGPSGSGKSTLIKNLSERFDNIAVISTDDYYIGKTRMRSELPSKLADNFDHPAAIDTKQIARDLEMLKNGQSIQKPVYDMSISEPSGKYEKIDPAQLIIIEGIVANQPSIAKHADVRIATFVDPEKRLAWRVKRDIVRKGKTPEQTMDYVVNVAEPAYLAYHYDNDKQADYIVDPTK